jgi:tetratricopeptide (TPR) repeat protein
MIVNKSKPLILFIFFISIVGFLQAEKGSTGTKEQASQLYHEANYEGSLKIWYDLVKSGNTDPNLYFNIGNAEAIQGHIPESVLAFEKALRYNPADKEIRNSLEKEREKIENAVIPVNEFFLLEWLRNLLSLFRPGTWSLVGLVIILIGLTNWLGYNKRYEKFRILTFNKWIYFTVGLLLITIALLAYQQIYRKDEAVVMVTCDCKQASSEESPLMRILHPGEKVRITDQIGVWKKVSLLNLDACWIKEVNLETIVVGM